MSDAQERALRVGIVGCGVIGPTHMEGFQRIPGVEVSRVCDLQFARAERLAQRYGVGQFGTDAHEVLADPSIDAVSICTDHASHADLSVAALEAGKHVLCEKPLSATPEGLDRMVAAEAAHPELVFAAVLQHRFDTLMRAVKGLVDAGELGTILSYSLHMSCLRTDAYYQADTWRGTWEGEGGSALINQAIHFMDLLTWFGGGVTEVSGRWANRTHQNVIETEDTAAAALSFADGALGTVMVTTASEALEWSPTIVVAGSKVQIEMRGGLLSSVHAADPGQQREIEERLGSCRDEHLLDAGKAYYGEGHGAQITDFVEAIRLGRRPYVSVQDARHVVDVIFGIYESSRTGQKVSVG